MGKKRPDPNAINLRCKVNYGKGLARNDLEVFKISGILLAILGLLLSVVLQLYADGRPSFLPDHFSYKPLFCNLLHLKLMAFRLDPFDSAVAPSLGRRATQDWALYLLS